MFPRKPKGRKYVSTVVGTDLEVKPIGSGKGLEPIHAGQSKCRLAKRQGLQQFLTLTLFNSSQTCASASTDMSSMSVMH